jgi:hypothetical protein
VVRLGDASDACTVSYRCEEASAKDGQHFTSVSGDLSFEPGVLEMAIDVPILATTAWNPTLEFNMQLSRPTNATLGHNLHQCRVWVIDNDRFPSSVVTSENTSRFTLLLEYFKHAYNNPVVRRGSLKTFAIDQMPNVLYVIHLWLQVKLVDDVLQPLTEQQQMGVEHPHYTQARAQTAAAQDGSARHARVARALVCVSSAPPHAEVGTLLCTRRASRGRPN